MDNLDLKKQLNELWIQRRELVIAGVLFVSSLLLIFVGTYRFWQGAQEIQVSLGQKRTELSQVEQRAILLNTISPDDRAGYELVERALPRFKEPLQVMRTLEVISQQTQIFLGEYDLNPGIVSTESARQSSSSRNTSSTARSSEALRIEIEVSGSFQQLTTAIDNMEQALPLMEIIDLRIAPARRASASDLSNVEYTATLQLESYYADIDPAQAARGGAQQITPGQRRAKERLEAMTYWLEGRTSSAPQDTESTGNTNFFQLDEEQALEVDTEATLEENLEEN